MISKERLQELIEQGATIYAIVKNPFIAGYSQSLEVEKFDLEAPIIKEISEDGKQFLYYDYLLDLEYLFETKEEAQWELEMTATRTETLKLPKFEELAKELDIPFMRYNEELESFVLYELYTYNNEICVLFREIHDNASDCLFRKPLTKENYIKACEICRKLFLGEEV